MVPVTSWGSLDAAQTWTLARLSKEGDLRRGGGGLTESEDRPAVPLLQGDRQPLRRACFPVVLCCWVAWVIPSLKTV